VDPSSGKGADGVDDIASVATMETDLTQAELRCLAAAKARSEYNATDVMPAKRRHRDNGGGGASDHLSDVLSVSSVLSSSTGVTSEAVPTARMRMPPPLPSPPPSSAADADHAQASGPCAEGIMSVLFAGKTKKGHTPQNPKKHNQDAFFMKHDPNTSSLIIACLDGHGQYGHDVSRYCKAYLEKYLCTHPAFESDVRKAIMETTAALERDMLAAPHIDTVFSGTTMTLLILRGTTVHVANVGDSRIVLGHSRRPILTRTLTDITTEEDAVDDSQFPSASSPHPTSEKSRSPATVSTMDCAESPRRRAAPAGNHYLTLQLTVDHKPDVPTETARIVGCGGRVKLVHDTARVYLATDDIPGLAMSRSLGDFVAHSVGVSSEPEYFEYDLSTLLPSTTSSPVTGSDVAGSSGGGRHPVLVRTVLLIGTDGVYDMISNETAVSMAFKHWGDPAAATDAIVKQTGARWMTRWGLVDDTTMCIVNLEHTALI